jgi:glycosyltransferase involved in cell wall biosynthesis
MVLAALLVIRRAAVPQLLGGVLAGIVVVAGYSLLERLVPDRFGRYDPTAVYRLTGPIGYWNGLGIFAAIGILLALAFVARGQRVATRASASLVVLPPTLYFTYSREASTALAIGLAAAIALDAWRLQLKCGGASGRVAKGVGNVRLLPPIPNHEIPALYANVQIVIQRMLVAGASLPSKIAPYLASGRPVVASIDPQTPPAEILRRSGRAVLVEPEHAHELANAMKALARNRVGRFELGRRGRSYAERVLSKDASLGRLEAAIIG